MLALQPLFSAALLSLYQGIQLIHGGDGLRGGLHAGGGKLCAGRQAWNGQWDCASQWGRNGRRTGYLQLWHLQL